MNLKEYQTQTWRTCPDLGSEGANLAHMVLGISSEYSELLDAKSNNDSVNISEEIADKFWYISNYCNFRNYSLVDLWDEANSILKTLDMSKYNVENYFYCLSRLQDIAKKNLAYGKMINDTEEKDLLLSLLISMHILWRDIDFDLERSLENNIAKLRVRFPDKFDKELAINRNLEAERIELAK